MICMHVVWQYVSYKLKEFQHNSLKKEILNVIFECIFNSVTTFFSEAVWLSAVDKYVSTEYTVLNECTLYIYM